MNSSYLRHRAFLRALFVATFSQCRRRWLRVALVSALAVPVLSAQTVAPKPVYRWTTVAGRANAGAEDGPSTDARFGNPQGLAMDLAGNLFVADTGNHTIRKITSTGLVSTFAGVAGQSGTADGTGSTARFNGPQGVAVDPAGNVYVADTGNHTVRKITSAGAVTTLAGQAGRSGYADGAASAALFDAPNRLSAGADGTVYLYNNGLRKISGGQVLTIPIPAQTLVVEGQSVAVGIRGCPAVDASGRLYFWSSSPGSYPTQYWGFIVIMDGVGQLTALPRLYDLTLGTGMNSIFNDAAGNIYATFDYLRLASGEYFMGGGPVATSVPADPVRFATASLDPTVPQGVAVDQAGHWYYTRSSDPAIVRDSSIYAGRAAGARNGTGAQASFGNVSHMDVDPSGNVWVTESVSNFVQNMSNPSHVSSLLLRKVTPAGVVSTAFGTPGDYYASHRHLGVATDGAGNVYFGDVGQPNPIRVYQLSPSGVATTLTGAPGYDVRNLASDPAGNLWTHSSYTGKMLRRAAGGDWAAVAGGGSNEIKDGQGEAARLGNPWSLKAGRTGDCYFLDATEGATGNVLTCFIRKTTPDGLVTTVSKDLATPAVVGGNITMLYPQSMAITSRGLFCVTDLSGIRLIDEQGVETVIGGAPNAFGTQDGVGDQARFNGPYGLAADAQDNLYVMDGLGATLRKGEFLGYTPGLTGQPQSASVTAGTTVQFAVTASGTPAPAYQWYFGGTALAGATGSTLTLANVRTSDAGDYTVVVTNALGSVTSSKATLTVTAATTPPPSTPASGGGTGGGGGGAPSAWFFLALSAAAGVRFARVLRPAADSAAP